MARCTIDVYDKTKQKYRKCLHARKWKCLCSFHARIYVVKIQAAWRAYKTKKTINVFKNLPTDLWELILHKIYLRNNMYKLYKSHLDVYERRIRCYDEFWRHARTNGEYNILLRLKEESKRNLRYFYNLLYK